MNSTTTKQWTMPRMGKLAREYCNVKLPIQVLQSAAGYYIGTFDDEGPCSRESEEYFATSKEAYTALETNNWTQRYEP
jgi:hypothetical protein